MYILCLPLYFMCVQDSVVQERLIEKYMSLPNEIWDSVIQRATVVSPSNTP